MTAYSLDLRKRVLRAWDSGMDAESVAAKYEVSREPSPAPACSPNTRRS